MLDSPKNAYERQSKYLKKMSTFRIYYEKTDHSAITKLLKDNGISPKEIFERGLETLKKP